MILVKDSKADFIQRGQLQWSFIVGERDWAQPEIQGKVRIYSQ